MTEPRPPAAAAGSFELSFDGRSLTALPGQSIAAALGAADIKALRTTRRGGERRGVFCGIGVCFDCLVYVDGDGPLRACLVAAEPGDTVTSAPAASPGLAGPLGPKGDDRGR